MLCDVCKKRPAVVHVCEIVDGKSKKLNLCLECVMSHAMPSGMKLQDVLKDMEKKLPEMIAASKVSLGHRHAGEHDRERSELRRRRRLKCDECGTTYDSYVKSGRVGCAHCYEAFSDDLSREFLVRQRSRIHVGKLPANQPDAAQRKQNSELQESAESAMDLKKRIAECTRNMDEAVLREEYELAAKYRNEILQAKVRLSGLKTAALGEED